MEAESTCLTRLLIPQHLIIMEIFQAYPILFAW